MIWCNVMWCNVMWCVVIWRDMMWCDVIWRDMMWCNVMWYDVRWCNVTWRDVTWRVSDSVTSSHPILSYPIAWHLTSPLLTKWPDCTCHHLFSSHLSSSPLFRQDGKTALMYAVEQGHTPIVSLLLKKGADHSQVDKVSCWWQRLISWRQCVTVFSSYGLWCAARYLIAPHPPLYSGRSNTVALRRHPGSCRIGDCVAGRRRWRQ
jgi:Ankyrin repeats (3 copies)